MRVTRCGGLVASRAPRLGLDIALCFTYLGGHGRQHAAFARDHAVGLDVPVARERTDRNMIAAIAHARK